MMLPDVYKRGGPRIQEQTFGNLPQDTIDALRCCMDSLPEELVMKMINEELPTHGKLDISKMGITASEATKAEMM